MFLVSKVVTIGGRVLVPDLVKNVDERATFGVFYFTDVAIM